MRLISTVLLSVGVVLMVLAFGSFTFVHGDNVPPWFISLLVPSALFASLYFSKNLEDQVLLPFAAASILFLFGSKMTMGVGVIVMAFGAVRFLDVEEVSRIPNRKDIPVLIAWVASATACFAAPYGLMRLSHELFSSPLTMAMPLVWGVMFLAGGAFLFQHNVKTEEKNKAG